MRNRRVLLLLILLLGIGFATITTTFYVRGGVNITTNQADFDVRFTKAVLDNSNVTTTAVSQDGKTLTFDTRDLLSVGDTSTLNFVVKNNSTMYDANISIDCGLNSSQYYSVTESVPSSVSARSQVTGSIQVVVTKRAVDNINDNINCSLDVSAVERNTVVTPNTGDEVTGKAVVYDYLTNGGTSATKTNDSITVGDIVDLSPSATKDGYSFVGWNTDRNAHVGLTTVSMDSDGVTLYAIFKKAPVTYTATFMLNGAGTQTNAGGEAIVGNVERTCTIGERFNNENQNATCNITSPALTGSVNTPEVVGYSTTQNSTSSTLAPETQQGINQNVTYYAITRNTGSQLVANFNANGATLSTTSEATCTILTAYNGSVKDTSCTVDAPTITASSNTPTIIGYSLESDDHTSNSAYNSTTGKITLTRENTGNIWYAQTKNDDITYRVNSFAAGTNVTSVADSSARTCTISKTYNGVAQAPSCSITPPEYTERTGYTKAGWTNSSSSSTGATSVLTMTANVSTYYAHATANSYTIEYYDGATLKGSTNATVDQNITLKTKTTLGLTNPGYTFKGWSTSSGSQTVTYNDGATITTNLSTTQGATVPLYAVWEDDIKPLCVFGTEPFAYTASTTTIDLTCTDEGSGIVSRSLAASDFTVSNGNGTITSVGAATAVTNGYKYTLTLTGVSVGTYTLTLPAAKFSDNASNTSLEVVSGNIETRGITYTATYTAGENITSLITTTASCTTTGSNTTCSITLPDANHAAGVVGPEWFLNNTSVGLYGDSYTLSSNVTLEGRGTVATATLVTYTDTYNMGCTNTQCAIDKINEIFS